MELGVILCIVYPNLEVEAKINSYKYPVQMLNLQHVILLFKFIILHIPFYISVETNENITQPVLEAINSTTISVFLSSIPHLPPRDEWSYSAQQEVLYYRTGYMAEEKSIAVNGSVPKTILVTGLQNETEYTIYVRYFGNINGSLYKINTIPVTANTTKECTFLYLYYY